MSSYKLPSNVTVFRLSFEDVKIRAAKFLVDEFGEPTEPSTILKKNYKLCDFKPIFHRLFEDLYEQVGIQPTDYFGWGDCDLLYGKLTNFIRLNTHDVIGQKGHFIAIRYVEPFISAYKKTDRLRQRLKHELNWYTDEQAFIDVLWDMRRSKQISYFETLPFICDIIPVDTYEELVKTYEDNRPIEQFVFDKPSGRLFAVFKDGELRETMYVHLQKRPMLVSYTDNYTQIKILKDRFILY
jgi:hypothetical protein